MHHIVPRGPPPPWEFLSALRWSGADSAPGIVIDRPDRDLALAAGRAVVDEPGDGSGEVHPRHLI